MHHVVGNIEQLTETLDPALFNDFTLAEPEILQDKKEQITSDGKTADYYELPPDAKQIQDLISFKNLNGQMAEIFRAVYRYGQCSHSPKLRDANKILFY